MIRVLVVDDHPIVRQGLVTALGDEADLAVIGAAGSVEEALLLTTRHQPDVVLLDLELPGTDGVAGIPRLTAAAPGAKVLVFTAYDTDERILGALRAGAKGYLLKGATLAEIAGAIRIVASGESALGPRIAARLVATVRSGRPSTALSPREREVLGLIAQGQQTKQIARALGIAERTVKFHTATLQRKLGAETRAQAVALAAQKGIL